MLSVSMPNSATFSALVDTATKWLRTAAASPSWPTSHSRADVALVIVSRVVNVFDDDDEQRLRRIEVVRRLPDVVAVDVGHEPALQTAVA